MLEQPIQDIQYLRRIIDYQDKLAVSKNKLLLTFLFTGELKTPLAMYE